MATPHPSGYVTASSQDRKIMGTVTSLDSKAKQEATDY